MKRNKSTKLFAAAITLTMAGVSNAEILDAAANGFTLRYQVTIEADRFEVYRAATSEISQWWSSDHTVSGNAANMSINSTVPGCFCEALGDSAGVVHMTVSFANPGVMIRLTGGLGPLGLVGATGNMTWEFDTVGNGTVITLQYAVGGYMQGGLGTLATEVDSVLTEAMDRLKLYIETGSPT